MNKFISSTLVLIFIAFSYADEIEDKLQALEVKFIADVKTCTNKSGMTEDQYLALMHFQIPKEKAPMCFLACLGKDFNLMDANNKFTKAGINNLMEPLLVKLKENDEDKGEQILELLLKCVDEQTDEKDECVSAKNGFECVVTNGKKNGIIRF